MPPGCPRAYTLLDIIMEVGPMAYTLAESAKLAREPLRRGILDGLLAISPLFDNLPPPRPLTRRERLTRRFNTYRDRVGDAWTVLRGRASIYD